MYLLHFKEIFHYERWFLAILLAGFILVGAKLRNNPIMWSVTTPNYSCHVSVDAKSKALQIL